MTNENDTVYDPYAGVASSLVAAVKHGRKAIGVDRHEKYIEIGRERIKRFFEGDLGTRPIGKPVFEPAGNEKIVQIPMEWLQIEGGAYK